VELLQPEGAIMTRRWRRLPFQAPILALPSVALAVAFWLGPAVSGQQPKPEAAPPKVEEKAAAPTSLGSEYDEEVTRTREELENIQLWLNAKRAQLKAAEASSTVEHKLQAEYDRLLKKGMTTTLRREIADLEFLESDSQRALIQAEIGDLQARYNRTKRYLARLEQNGTSAMKAPEDHTLELTEVQTRLKYAERMIVKLQEELKDTKAELEVVTRPKPRPKP
jgi:chromosome segregation ATPase